MTVTLNPTCSLCAEPIPPGASAALYQGTLVHIACWILARPRRRQASPDSHTAPPQAGYEPSKSKQT